GFMQEIERFTKQQIPAKVVEGFGPEPGEQAEPIAMGRQVLWGGAGRMPSREVMNAAAKAARGEMLQRIRENKAGSGQPAKGQRSAEGGRGQRNGDGGKTAARNGNGNGNGSGNGAARPPQGNGNRPPRQGAGRNAPAHGHGQPPVQGQVNGNGQRQRPEGDDQPRLGAHNSASPFVIRDAVQRSTDGQPDPLRTSVDIMANKNGRRGGGRPNRTGGGGVGPR